DIQQNEETGETTSEGVLESTPADASSVDGAILITNGIDSDLPAPPPELVENGIASKVEAEAIIANVEEDPIYDTADQVTKIEEKADNISHKSNSELETIVSFDKVDLDDEKIETHSEKTDSIKDEPVQEIIKAEPEPEPVEIAPAKSVSSILKTNDIEVPHELPKNNGKVKDTDISNPLNLVNLSVEEMRQKLSTKKRVNKFKDMNLKEKHEILEKL
ncbi:Na(+)/H(+) exchange regulatory cofactor NHE-RF3-like, partial [Argonauta hians]